MKKIKKFEGYFYNNDGKIYQDEEMENIPDSYWATKPSYINESLGKHIPELKSIKDRLIEINDDLENVGPLDEDIQDTVDLLQKILDKWENRPINKAAKKYNL